MKNNEEFSIPLYHGTSSAFIPSIEEFGLGGINIYEKYNVLPTLEELISICRKELKEECTEWVKAQSIFDISTPIHEGYSNQQHVNVFVTPSMERATIRYAKPNSLGSETLSILKTLFDKLKVAHSDQLEQVFHENMELLDILNTETFPIVIQVNDLIVSDLTHESHDASVQFVFEELRELIEESPDHLEHSLMTYDFILKKPIAFDKLIIHKL